MTVFIPFFNLTLDKAIPNGRVAKSLKTIEKSKSVTDNNGQVLFYVVSYKEGGFALVSGSRNVIPILAHSATGSFPLDKQIPTSVQAMLTFYKTEIKKAIAKNEQTKEVEALWSRFENGSLPDLSKSGRTTSEPEGGCEDEYEYIAPLINTQWGQGFLDYYLCDGSLYQNGMHMNWGWEGQFNGNYFYPNPNGHNYTPGQGMIIQIKH